MTPARLKAAMPLIEATEGMPGLLARRGALGFLLHTLRAARKDSWDRNGDPVAAAVALWTGEHSPLLDFSFGVARDKLRARGASAADLGWNNPQLLAALTPYPVFVANLARQRGHERLTDGARNADARLAKAGALMTDEALTPAASSPFAGLAELGLFAEWAQAEAMFARDPDLAAIGRAAERWRRTVAGDWRYSGPPTGWQQAGPLDAVLAKRLDRLLDHSNPQDAAHAQLGLWSSQTCDGKK